MYLQIYVYTYINISSLRLYRYFTKYTQILTTIRSKPQPATQTLTHPQHTSIKFSAYLEKYAIIQKDSQSSGRVAMAMVENGNN